MSLMAKATGSSCVIAVAFRHDPLQRQLALANWDVQMGKTNAISSIYCQKNSGLNNNQYCFPKTV